MAFTASQKQKIINHLNYPNNSWALSLIDSKTSAITSLGSDFETAIGNMLTQLDSVETAMNSYTDMGIQVKTDGTVFYAGGVVGELLNKYKYWQRKLATALGIEIYNQSLQNKIYNVQLG
jgi:hypothetical protein